MNENNEYNENIQKRKKYKHFILYYPVFIIAYILFISYSDIWGLFTIGMAILMSIIYFFTLLCYLIMDDETEIKQDDDIISNNYTTANKPNSYIDANLWKEYTTLQKEFFAACARNNTSHSEFVEPKDNIDCHESIMMLRNILGREYEKEKNVDKAIQLYEKNISVQTVFPFPYERLAIIYRRLKQYSDEQRVLEVAIDVYENRVNENHYGRDERLNYFIDRLAKSKKLADSAQKKLNLQQTKITKT